MERGIEMRPPTNRYNLPAPVVAAVTRYAEKYDRGGADITATRLGEPMRIVALKERHGEEIQEDASDLLYALDGHIVHEILEQTGGPDLIVEKRFRATFGGWVVSGQVDLFDPTTGTLSDYKRVSVASRKRGVKEEWVWQLNVLAELLRQNGYQVAKVEAVRWYRDWSLSATLRETDYPACAVETIPLPLWTPDIASHWINDRVWLHQMAVQKTDDDLPLCTEKERYNDGPTFAVMKPGKDRALRVLPTEPEAALWLAAHPGAGQVIVARQGTNKRCQLYCNVWQWCALGRKEHEKAEQERPTVEVSV
jgi:hypothetical protein